MIRIQIVMHLKSVKYECKYALKIPKFALKNSETSTTNVKTIKIKSIFLQKAKKKLQNVHAKKYFPDLLIG
jgi:hypothetical protein